MSDITYVCKDDPEANGRTPQFGDVRYVLMFPLEDGRTLSVYMGQDGLNHIKEIVNQAHSETAMERLIATVEGYHENQ
jgi:hypothetical protein